MKKLMQKIKCWVGFHFWQYLLAITKDDVFQRIDLKRLCIKCSKYEVLNPDIMGVEFDIPNWYIPGNPRADKGWQKRVAEELKKIIPISGKGHATKRRSAQKSKQESDWI